VTPILYFSGGTKSRCDGYAEEWPRLVRCASDMCKARVRATHAKVQMLLERECIKQKSLPGLLIKTRTRLIFSLASVADSWPQTIWWIPDSQKLLASQLEVPRDVHHLEFRKGPGYTRVRYVASQCAVHDHRERVKSGSSQVVRGRS
jgi:hypothetical protein